MIILASINNENKTIEIKCFLSSILFCNDALILAALSSPRTEEGKQSESQTLLSTLLNETEAGCSERDRMYELLSQNKESS